MTAVGVCVGYRPAYEDGTDKVFRNVDFLALRLPGGTQKKTHYI